MKRLSFFPQPAEPDLSKIDPGDLPPGFMARHDPEAVARAERAEYRRRRLRDEQAERALDAA